ncbi:tyr-2, partial [Pristionchus pacificus]
FRRPTVTMRLSSLLTALAVFVLQIVAVRAQMDGMNMSAVEDITKKVAQIPEMNRTRPVAVKPLATMAPLIKQALFPDWKAPPRDCSDAPNKDIFHTCMMNREMDQMTRSRLRRQAQLLARAGGGRGASPLSPSIATAARRQAIMRRRLQNRVTVAPTPTTATQTNNINVEDSRIDGAPNWQQPVPVPMFARGQTAYHPYDCMTLQCVCPFFQGQMRNGTCYLQQGNGQPLLMAYRKEYRMMSDNERNRWHNALNTLKRNGVYDQLSRQHLEVGVGSGAHSGPGFLTWHREYLKRVELALRMVDPGVAIPYWDSVMDNYLPDPRDSIMFTNMFAGETDGWGNVVQGPFAYWPTLEGRGTILRNLGQEGSLFTEAQINNVVAQNDIEYVMAYTAPLDSCPFPNNYGAVEYVHSNVHLWIGGDMKPPSTSANEPIFFMHHSFVDYMWELWRQLKQPRWFRETAYAPDIGTCANPLHFSYANMRPFPYLLNRDGLSNSYTDQMYRYAPRPTCSMAQPTCGSPYLFCDTRGYPHCVAKIRLNGVCRGYEGFNSCYMGRCWFGRCVQAPAQFRFARKARTAVLDGRNVTTAPITALPLTTAARVSVKPYRRVANPPQKMAAPLFVDCYNRHPCCDSWSDNGMCGDEPEWMSQYCQASCEVCAPGYKKTDECADRHPSCTPFRKVGMCLGASSPFMQENCRASCGWCTQAKKDVCYQKGEVIKIPAEKVVVNSIRYSFDKDAERKQAALEQAVRRRARRGARHD